MILMMLIPRLMVMMVATMVMIMVISTAVVIRVILSRSRGMQFCRAYDNDNDEIEGDHAYSYGHSWCHEYYYNVLCQVACAYDDGQCDYMGLQKKVLDFTG